jgi:histone deacetylase 6
LDILCHRIPSRKATIEELTLCHDEKYIKGILNKDTFDHHSDIFLNAFTSQVALLSAGSVITGVEQVVKGDVQNAMIVCRPPGHHATKDTAMGFCFFNNVGVAVQKMIDSYGLKRVFIFDFDVHHGNGTQEIFYESDQVLYASIHKYGSFYPGSGSVLEVGKGKGKGYNVNIPLTGKEEYGDVEYMLATTKIILPILLEWKPELIVISAGFDAVKGDPLGKMGVTPNGFAQMLHVLKTFANGRIVCALEGGYNQEETAKCVVACLRVLLGESPKTSDSRPLNELIHVVIDDVKKVQGNYWKYI